MRKTPKKNKLESHFKPNLAITGPVVAETIGLIRPTGYL